MLEVRRLRLLCELKARGTIAAVGEALHLTPSGVSQQLSLLEQEVGVPLLERVGRRVRLTEAAFLLVEHAQVILMRLEQAEADLANTAHTVRGLIRVASFQSASLAFLPGVLDLLDEHPLLRIETVQMEPDDALRGLTAHDFDLVLGEEYPDMERLRVAGIHREDLLRDPIQLAAPMASDLSTSAPLLDCRDMPWVMEPSPASSRRWATAQCRAAGFEPDVRYESDDLISHVSLVACGRAAAFIPDLVWRSHQAQDIQLARLPGLHRVVFTAVREGSERHPALRRTRVRLRQLAGV